MANRGYRGRSADQDDASTQNQPSCEEQKNTIKTLMNEHDEMPWLIPFINAYFIINCDRNVPAAIVAICARYYSIGLVLGASWFLISKDWWDNWCNYTGYSPDEAINTSLRQQKGSNPGKISNRRLVEEDSKFTVLKHDVKEYTHFVLLPKTIWKQLKKWYGGGPEIKREVICKDPNIRMKVTNFLLPKFKYGYQQKKGNKVAFDINKFNREYNKFLHQMSFTARSSTLRIDLDPIGYNFVKIENNQIPHDKEQKSEISRYGTLPELYIRICSSLGYEIKNIEIEKNNYREYLQYKYEKNNDKIVKPLNIPLPPRMWNVARKHRGKHIDRLLYPIPKLSSSENKENKECEDIRDNKDDTEDLEELGLSSGTFIAVEFAEFNEEFGGIKKYGLYSTLEEVVCVADVNPLWLQFEVGGKVDGRDRWGKWYRADIKHVKKANESMPKTGPKLQDYQERDIKKLEKLEAIYVHYSSWEEKWDHWIFIDPKVSICNCRQKCLSDKDKHRVAPYNTQSKYRKKRNKANIILIKPEGRESMGSIIKPPLLT